MDIRNYFNAVDFKQFQDSPFMNRKQSLGAAIEKNTSKFSPQNAAKTNLAIIGVPFICNAEKSDSPDKIRNEIYKLAQPNNIKIVDFGNLINASTQKGNYLAMRDVVDYFNELKVPLVIIGGSQDLSYGVCEAFKNHERFSFSTIDYKLDVKTTNEAFSEQNYISKIYSSLPNLFQFNLLAYQSYYVPTDYLNSGKAINRHLRLGEIRTDIKQAEPILRDTHFLSFDAQSIINVQNVEASLPNGLQGDEACQLAKYAGLSENLNVFGLFNTYSENPVRYKLLAQLIWYYVEGVGLRKNENPESDKSIVNYHVNIDGVEKPFIFLKSKNSNRWWLKIGLENNKPLYVACSENDYIIATQNEIPELWLKFV